jgi:hypothetical protein
VSNVNDYVYLNGKIFSVLENQSENIWIGGNFERTLSGRGTIDRKVQKNDFNFIFLCDERQKTRLKNIFDSNSSISLTDVDGGNYTVIITSTFKPIYNRDDTWTISLDMKQI